MLQRRFSQKCVYEQEKGFVLPSEVNVGKTRSNRGLNIFKF